MSDKEEKKLYKEYMTNDQSWDRTKVMMYICDMTATSSRSVGNILGYATNELGRFPSYSTIMQWLTEDKELSDKYARAKEAQADYMADEMLDIADDGSNDWMIQKRGDMEVEVVNKDVIQRSRLRIDTRKWLASKLKPKKYGEKIQQEVTGKDGGPITTLDLSAFSEDELKLIEEAGIKLRGEDV